MQRRNSLAHTSCADAAEPRTERVVAGRYAAPGGRHALGDGRSHVCGTTDQIAADIAATKEIGATQLFFDPSFDPAVRSFDDYVGRLELCAGLAR